MVTKPDWLPLDWRDESLYPDPNKTHPRLWAWEYLRRNSEYLRQCDRIGKEWFDELRRLYFEISKSVTKEDLKLSVNPIKRKGEAKPKSLEVAIIQWLNVLFSEEEFKEPPGYHALCLQFGLLYADYPDQQYPLTIFSTDFGFRDTGKHPNIYIKQGSLYEKAQKIRLYFFNQGITDGITLHNRQTKNERTRHPGGITHRKYLRILDAFFVDADVEELAKVLYGSVSKISSVDKAFQIAINYVDSLYLELPSKIVPVSYQV
jgi:hypothetical protein